MTTSASSKPAATPTLTPTQLSLADTMITAPDTQPFFLFQVAGDARLRGMSWDGATNGLFTRSGPFGLSSQSPDGRYAVLSGSVYDRHGLAVGAFPWSSKDLRATWSTDSAVMCKVPDLGVAGGTLRLELAAVGHRPRTVAQGFGTFHDQSGFPVLACDPKRDRAIVAEFTQGFSPSQAWVLQISTGRVVRSIGLAGAPIAAAADGSLLATSSMTGQTWRTTIEAADDGTVLATINDFAAHGFAGDSSLLVGSGPNQSTVVLDWRTGKHVWSSSTAPYFGYFSEPGGSHLVVGLTSTSGYLGEAFLIGKTGALAQLPSGIAAALNY